MPQSRIIIDAETKMKVVLSVLTGGSSVAEAARQAEVSASSVRRWIRRFLDGGGEALQARPSARPAQSAHRAPHASELVVQVRWAGNAGL